MFIVQCAGAHLANGICFVPYKQSKPRPVFRVRGFLATCIVLLVSKRHLFYQ